jgi:hypothetical protein
MRALLIVLRLAGVAGGAGRFGNSGGVWIFVVPLMAGGARNRRMSAIGKLLRLVVTGGAIRRKGMVGGHAKEAEEQWDEPGGTQPRWIS